MGSFTDAKERRDQQGIYKARSSFPFPTCWHQTREVHIEMWLCLQGGDAAQLKQQLPSSAALQGSPQGCAALTSFYLGCCKALSQHWKVAAHFMARAGCEQRCTSADHSGFHSRELTHQPRSQRARWVLDISSCSRESHSYGVIRQTHDALLFSLWLRRQTGAAGADRCER